MNLYIIIDGGDGPDGDTWTFRDDEYLEALAMYRNLGRGQKKGLLLQDGTDGVWLERTTAEEAATQNYFTWASLRKIFGA